MNPTIRWGEINTIVLTYEIWHRYGSATVVGPGTVRHPGSATGSRFICTFHAGKAYRIYKESMRLVVEGLRGSMVGGSYMSQASPPERRPGHLTLCTDDPQPRHCRISRNTQHGTFRLWKESNKLACFQTKLEIHNSKLVSSYYWRVYHYMRNKHIKPNKYFIIFISKENFNIFGVDTEYRKIVFEKTLPKIKYVLDSMSVFFIWFINILNWKMNCEKIFRILSRS